MSRHMITPIPTYLFPFHLCNDIWRKYVKVNNISYFQVSWCNNYQHYTTEMFYELLSNGSSNSTVPCRQFLLEPIPGTSLFLLAIPSKGKHHCAAQQVSMHNFRQSVCSDRWSSPRRTWCHSSKGIRFRRNRW